MDGQLRPPKCLFCGGTLTTISVYRVRVRSLRCLFSLAGILFTLNAVVVAVGASVLGLLTYRFGMFLVATGLAVCAGMIAYVFLESSVSRRELFACQRCGAEFNAISKEETQT